MTSKRHVDHCKACERAEWGVFQNLFGGGKHLPLRIKHMRKLQKEYLRLILWDEEFVLFGGKKEEKKCFGEKN